MNSITKDLITKRIIMILNIFDANTQTTETPGLSPEMKTYYEKRLIQLASPKLVYDQFGDKYPIPKNGGKNIEFRKYSPLEKANTPLTEGVTPTGNSMNVTTITGEVKQYGGWIGMSDMFLTSAIDNNVVEATKLLASQAGRTLDTVTREVLCGGTNVRYAPKVNGTTVTEVSSRADIDSTALITPELVFKANADLSAMNADPVDDCYVGIVHPHIEYDLMRNDEWIEAHKYAQPENIYAGEIGKLGGVRFVRSSEAKIFGPAKIAANLSRFTVKTAVSSSTTSVAINEAVPAESFATPVPVYVDGVENTITAITVADGVSSVTLGTAVTSLSVGAVICGKGGGKDGSAVYATIIVGAHAYGTTELEGGGLEHITKPLGYGDDPLNQRASCGWKATKATVRLVEPYMIRLETGSSYSDTSETN